ncbi:MAG: 4-carboxymuconolactone decarboxylase [Pseudohongiellaceae bacterium]|nr:4-carboxymuconolactone decarboxylase [Gammaproteobacteria bacterium]|tara:strand:- start:2189 stop:2581 length:393 start_codon:yes stop_codon:yes gene_type:complete
MSNDKSDNVFFDLGLQVRKEVLGAAYVDNTLNQSSDFDREFQRWITSTAWGAIWGRTELSLRDRSLITITQLASLGNLEELALHLRATKNTGLSKSDVKEALMQVGVYSGVPAANAAFRIAKKVFEEMED